MVMMDQPRLEDDDWCRDDEVYVGHSRLRMHVPVPATKKASEDRYYVTVWDKARITYIASFPSLAVVQQHPIVDTIILLPNVLKNLGE